MKLNSTIAALTVMVLLAGTAQAAESDCPQDAAFCIYTHGFDSSNQFGRNIKIEFSGGQSGVFCMNHSSVFVLPQNKADSQATPTTYTSYICRDRFGQQCDEMGKGGFTLTKGNDSYLASPNSDAIDVSKALNQDYPACLPSASSLNTLGNFLYNARQ